MIVDLYRIRDGMVLKTVVTGGSEESLARTEAEWVREHGTTPGGVVAIPRLGVRQRESLRHLSHPFDESHEMSCGEGKNAMMRLSEMGFAKFRWVGGRTGYHLFWATDKGMYAARALRLLEVA